MSNFDTFLFLLVIFLYVYLLIWGSGNIPSKKERQSRKHRQWLEKVKLVIMNSNLHLKMVYNHNQGVLAVCTMTAFEKLLVEHNKLVAEGKKHPWEKVVVRATPTFTFSDEKSDLRPVHTGTKMQAEEVLHSAICRAAHILHSELQEKGDFEALLSLVLVKDNRLYVPFSAGTKDGESEFQHYGYTTLGQFRDYVFTDVFN